MMNRSPRLYRTPEALQRVGFLWIALLLAGCASGGESAGGGGVAAQQSGALQEISQEEISASGAIDGWDLIQRLRPSWLTNRSGTILLFVNGQRRGETGGVEQYLRAQATNTIARVEWVRPEDASRLPQAPTERIGGAILLTLRGGGE